MEELANKFTLDHLKTYNMEAGPPVAPEGRDKSFALSGDKYSNFNAGKILLILEGIGGLLPLLQCSAEYLNSVHFLSPRIKIFTGG